LGDGGWTAGDGAGGNVELAAMPPAADTRTVDIAVSQWAASVAAPEGHRYQRRMGWVAEP
jgi:hypothetical protein